MATIFNSQGEYQPFPGQGSAPSDYQTLIVHDGVPPSATIDLTAGIVGAVNNPIRNDGSVGHIFLPPGVGPQFIQAYQEEINAYYSGQNQSDFNAGLIDVGLHDNPIIIKDSNESVIGGIGTLIDDGEGSDELEAQAFVANLIIAPIYKAAESISSFVGSVIGVLEMTGMGDDPSSPMYTDPSSVYYQAAHQALSEQELYRIATLMSFGVLGAVAIGLPGLQNLPGIAIEAPLVEGGPAQMTVQDSMQIFKDMQARLGTTDPQVVFDAVNLEQSQIPGTFWWRNAQIRAGLDPDVVLAERAAQDAAIADATQAVIDDVTAGDPPSGEGVFIFNTLLDDDDLLDDIE